MKIEKEVEIRECDRCHTLFRIWLDGGKDDGPDYKLKYLGKDFDLCPDCYGRVTRWLENKGW